MVNKITSTYRRNPAWSSLSGQIFRFFTLICYCERGPPPPPQPTTDTQNHPLHERRLKVCLRFWYTNMAQQQLYYFRHVGEIHLLIDRKIITPNNAVHKHFWKSLILPMSIARLDTISRHFQGRRKYGIYQYLQGIHFHRLTTWQNRLVFHKNSIWDHPTCFLHGYLRTFISFKALSSWFKEVL